MADRVLIVRLGAMGDVVRTLPAAQTLRQRYPGAHLSWLVEPASAGVVRASGVVDEVLVFPRGDLEESLRTGDALRLIRQVRYLVDRLRRRRFDLAIDFHGILKSGILTRLSGAPLRIGFARGAAREGAQRFLNHRVDVPDPEISRYARNDLLVEALVQALPGAAPRLSSEEAKSIELRASPLAAARLTARLRVTHRADESGVILLHPGTSRGALHKRYPAESWAEVARQLTARKLRVWVLAGASRDERRLVDTILRQAGGDVVAAPESRSFDDLLALYERASVFASADTGPLHAASLAGVPVVQVLGPTHPRQNEPWAATPWRRAHVPVMCSPCRRGCAAATCMSVIPPESVVAGILDLYGLAADSASVAPSAPAAASRAGSERCGARDVSSASSMHQSRSRSA